MLGAAIKRTKQKRQLVCYITTEQAEKLEKLKEKSRVPVAVYVREGIDYILKRYK